MLKFVVDENEQPVDRDTARKYFKKYSSVEFAQALLDFGEAIRDAFVNPTKGETSSSPISTEKEPSPSGSQS
jgi:hypothetical protein